MADRDLILGVLAVQAGFVSPAEVMSAASAWLIEKDPGPLVSRLERAGALTAARRKLLDEMVDEALVTQGGDHRRALAVLGGVAALSHVFGDSLPLDPALRESVADIERAVPAERAGQYTPLGELGRGGQSIVHRTFDEFLGREVALKQLLPTPSDTPRSQSSTAAHARFLRESRLTAQLDHPNIVAVHELARRPDGTLVCAQKLVRGETLKARLARCESLPQRLLLLPHLIDACHAVAYAHSRGVIHRDLKPSNIMVGAFGETVVVDWGLAKKRGEVEPLDTLTAGSSLSEPALTIAGMALGTPAYMSPEQANGALDRIDERSDVFSLGIILYQLLTGRLPFEGPSAKDVISRVLEGRFTPVRSACAEAPAELAAVAERALRSDPKGRYSGADPLAKELADWLAGGRVRAYEYSSLALLQRFIAKNKTLSAVSVAAVVALAVAVVAVTARFQTARANLADALLAKARAAASSADWAAAAGYFAASRVQRDSAESRWGVALARARMPRRVLLRTGAPGSAAEVGFLPDGRALLFSRQDAEVVARDFESDREQWRLRMSGPVDSLQLLRGGGRLAVTSGNTVRIVDPGDVNTAGEYLKRGHNPCFSPDGKRFAFFLPQGNLVDGRARFVVSRDGRETELFARGLSTGPGIFNCEFAGDGRRVAVFGPSGWGLWDTDSRKELLPLPELLPGPPATQEDFTVGLLPDAIQSIKGTMRFAIPTAQRLWVPLALSSARIAAFSNVDHDRVDVFDLARRLPLAVLQTSAPVGGIALSAQGTRLALRSEDSRQAELWDLAPPGATSLEVGSTAPFRDIQVSDDGTRLVVADSQTRAIHVWRMPAGTTEATLADVDLSTGTLALSADGRRISAAEGDVALFWDRAGQESLVRFPCKTCLKVALSQDGSRLLAVKKDGLELFDTKGGRSLWERPLDPAYAAPDELEDFFAARISPDGKVFAIGLDSRPRIVLHDLLTGQRLAQLELGADFTDLAFSRDGARLFVLTRKSVELWDLASRAPVWRRPRASQWGRVAWAADQAHLLVHEYWRGISLFDSLQGDLLAEIEMLGKVYQDRTRALSPDLRFQVHVFGQRLHLAPFPGPELRSPDLVLAEVLAAGGLSLEGVELRHRSEEAPKRAASR